MPRSEVKWIARATSSLPVPDSPVISTLESVRATFSIRRKTCWMLSPLPMMFSKLYLSRNSRRRKRFSRNNAFCAKALRTTAFR